MARRPGAARPLLGGRGPAALVARALVSASLGLGRRGRRRTGGSSSRAPPPSTLLGGCPGLLQGPGGGPAGLQTSDGSAPVSRHTGALAPRTHRRQRDHGGTEDGRVLVCPPCNGPVPVRRGESPDVAVGAHVDGDCRRPPGQETAKVFTSRCSREGCRREILRAACEECRGSLCLQHRRPLDHGCARRGHPGSLAG